MTITQRSKEIDAMQKKALEANAASPDKVSTLRSALRSAPRKKGARSRSPLKAAVVQLLPDLLAFRAKGYTGAELAEIMRNNGFIIAAGTLNRYINEARGRSGARKNKAAPAAAESKATKVKSGSRTADAARTMATPLSLLATKPPPQSRRAAKDVLGHRFDDDV